MKTNDAQNPRRVDTKGEQMEPTDEEIEQRLITEMGMSPERARAAVSASNYTKPSPATDQGIEQHDPYTLSHSHMSMDELEAAIEALLSAEREKAAREARIEELGYWSRFADNQYGGQRTAWELPLRKFVEQIEQRLTALTSDDGEVAE